MPGLCPSSLGGFGGTAILANPASKVPLYHADAFYKTSISSSSTMWTERIGFVASLATLKKMETHSIQKNLVEYGQRIKDGWQNISKIEEVDLSVGGLDSIPLFSFNYDNNIELLTFFNQQMLTKGFLLDLVFMI